MKGEGCGRCWASSWSLSKARKGKWDFPGTLKSDWAQQRGGEGCTFGRPLGTAEGLGSRDGISEGESRGRKEFLSLGDHFGLGGGERDRSPPGGNKRRVQMRKRTRWVHWERTKRRKPANWFWEPQREQLRSDAAQRGQGCKCRLLSGCTDICSSPNAFFEGEIKHCHES